jgi:hypothetical protein
MVLIAAIIPEFTLLLLAAVFVLLSSYLYFSDGPVYRLDDSVTVSDNSDESSDERE